MPFVVCCVFCHIFVSVDDWGVQVLIHLFVCVFTVTQAPAQGFTLNGVYKLYNLGFSSLTEQNKFDNSYSSGACFHIFVQWTLVTTTAFVPKDVAIKMNLLL